MQRYISTIFLLTSALAGCAAHEVYEIAGSTSSTALADWSECQASAIAATGGRPIEVGGASIDGNRLLGTVVTPETTDGGMYKPEDYLRITKRRQLRQDCMTAKGYHFLGIPAVERL
jgi:hypothetical protein